MFKKETLCYLFDWYIFRIFHIWIKFQLVISILNYLSKLFKTNFLIKWNDLYSNIRKIDSGIGYEFLLITGVIFCIVLNIFASFIVNWKLTLIMVCILPLILITSVAFSKVEIILLELNKINFVRLLLMKKWMYWIHIQKLDKLLKKYLVQFEQFFHWMARNSKKNGKKYLIFS